MKNPEWNLEIVPMLDHDHAKNYKREFIPLKSMSKLSDAIQGFDRGELIGIVAAPGSGKTALARTFAIDLLKNGSDVLFCTYELSLAQCAAMFKEAGLDKLPNSKMLYAPREYMERDILFIEKLLEQNKTDELTCLIIDDLHALESKYAFVREQNQALIMRALCQKLKEIAQRYNIIIITMAHLKKDAIKSTALDLSDVAYSGGLGQVADTVIALRRLEDEENRTELAVIKARWTGTKTKIQLIHEDKIFREAHPFEEFTEIKKSKFSK